MRQRLGIILELSSPAAGRVPRQMPSLCPECPWKHGLHSFCCNKVQSAQKLPESCGLQAHVKLVSSVFALELSNPAGNFKDALHGP